MRIIKPVIVNGIEYPVTISDDSMALQAAYAAGGAIIGIWSEETAKSQTDYSYCLYLVTNPEDADEMMLERVVRRRLGLPFIIGETSRLIIREFCRTDPLEPMEWAYELAKEALASEEETEDFSSHLTFCMEERRTAYIRNQYYFHECGLWALEEKESGIIVGKAGLTEGELGYHIYPFFRRKGYSLEACKEILRYGREEMGLKEIFLRTRKDNIASLCLAKRLGFLLREEQKGVCEMRIFTW